MQASEGALIRLSASHNLGGVSSFFDKERHCALLCPCRFFHIFVSGYTTKSIGDDDAPEVTRGVGNDEAAGDAVDHIVKQYRPTRPLRKRRCMHLVG